MMLITTYFCKISINSDPISSSGRRHMVLSCREFRQHEYYVPEEEVDEGLLKLDLLDEGTVPA
jgi:hypothetical protein